MGGKYAILIKSLTSVYSVVEVSKSFNQSQSTGDNLLYVIFKNINKCVNTFKQAKRVWTILAISDIRHILATCRFIDSLCCVIMICCLEFNSRTSHEYLPASFRLNCAIYKLPSSEILMRFVSTNSWPLNLHINFGFGYLDVLYPRKI